ncbi:MULTISPECIES: type 1 glutamine amidotransferase domain-containing protein [Saccharothrix]|uniref:type 1 glutamine amidotransferase domain-containing protein n=1 Tax=Saccharothrix TaxID=2071 RepID=UPI00093F2A5E|nr:type 1 glutamine amidotransferase domain-containing protein [Saccharothrix sp. CB00851]OKI34569.1 thiamine biosynthesis protein ThiJ [Saccharothrix sp. CB00851]
MSRVLVVVSVADELVLADGSSHSTGFWAEEVVESVRVPRDAGVRVDIATPGGARPTMDAASRTDEFDAYLASIEGELAAPLRLADVDVADYDAVLLPGGHGPMADLAFDADLGRLLVAFDDAGKVVGALCHGPAGLLAAVREDGTFAFAGRRPAVFTDEEERQGGLAVPYSLEARLRELGAVPQTGPAWSSTVVVDGNLITGQNPQSSVDTARRVLEAVS